MVEHFHIVDMGVILGLILAIILYMFDVTRQNGFICK